MKLHIVFKEANFYYFKSEWEFFVIEKKDDETIQECLIRNYYHDYKLKDAEYYANIAVIKEVDDLTLVRLLGKPMSEGFWGISEKDLLTEKT